ncbi:hypothetical protein [Methylobacterium haplocladii]|uniref:Uncharacterized protein n=1 Tax=Methylobacterium haplocladii TaxID=1176176 RepID=A0A512INC5_9HYPH|nr:hypothetical protein [Methylobacterium haplocladii]GEO99213.1 hypothetical protein MHA02_16010 [Methylobacterium haplocladii]GJD83703.1 hypothetical protein HPGCJGGD_1573 [Methylobacterium haplocladii]GLS59083.1 hypothetical protein GCM10007887_17490 [Methylobacterium haplocladii]
MTVTSTRFRISVDPTGHDASPWSWSVYRYGAEQPLMRSTAMFSKRSEAEAAGQEAVADLRLSKQREERQELQARI